MQIADQSGDLKSCSARKPSLCSLKAPVLRLLCFYPTNLLWSGAATSLRDSHSRLARITDYLRFEVIDCSVSLIFFIMLDRALMNLLFRSINICRERLSISLI
jgi:hypothetical protein